MAVVRGVDVLIYVNTGTETTPVWTVVGGQRGAKLTEENEPIDVTNKTTADGADYEYGIPKWKLTCDGVYINDDAGYQALKQAKDNRTPIKVRIQEDGTYTSEGYAIIASLEIEAPYDDVATYSIELVGKRKLTPVT